MEAVGSTEQALELARADGAAELCVIGGGEIYALCLPSASRMHLTRVDTEVEGADTFFPRFDRDEWREVARESHRADERNEFDVEYVEYVRLGMD